MTRRFYCRPDGRIETANGGMNEDVDPTAILAIPNGSSLVLKWDALRVKEGALRAMADRVDHGPDLQSIHLVITHDDWVMQEHFAWASAASARIREALHLLNSPNIVTFSQQRCKRVAIDGDNAQSRIGSVIGAWSNSRQTADQDFITALLSLDLLDRTIVYVHDKGQDDLVFRYIGRSFAEKFGAERVESGIGSGISETLGADSAYTSFVAQHSVAAFQSGEARRDHIDSVISLPQKKPQRVQYDRVILPISLPNGTRGLATVSEVRAGLLDLAT